jgi:hypothetical protein
LLRAKNLTPSAPALELAILCCVFMNRA